MRLPETARGAAGLVTSPHELASIEGRRVLAKGGNAIEAAIAMGAVLAVVYPHFCGLGGDAVWLVADRDGESRCFLGIGQAGRKGGGTIPQRGAESAATSACLVDSWGHAHDFAAHHWGGRLALPALLERAIELAEEGFALSPSQRFWLDFRKEEWPSWPGFAALFDTSCLGDQPFRQPQLASTLRAIATGGPREFYDVDLARRIAEGLSAAGSPLTEADLADTRTREVEAIRLGYEGYELLAPPPPTQGVTTLAIMGVLERLGIGGTGEGSPEFYHLLVEAIKQAFLQRGAIGDPDFSDQPVAEWLAGASLDRLAAGVDREAALQWAEPFRTGDTVFLAAVDGEGRCASLLQSTYFDWGSGVVAGDTGILWQNRAAAFTGGANVWRPGARPFYTLNPGIALKDGRPALLYGTQGADGQPQTLASLLARTLSFGMPPAAALAAPRFLLGRTFSDSRDTLKLERDAGEAVFADLAGRGHEMAELPPASPISGQAGLIRIDGDGAAEGAHDPRSDGLALAVG